MQRRRRRRRYRAAGPVRLGRQQHVLQVARAGRCGSVRDARRDRRNRKRDFRRLWITRISAACRARGTTYSVFMNGLLKAGVTLDRKVLSTIAIEDPAAFDSLVEEAKAARG